MNTRTAPRRSLTFDPLEARNHPDAVGLAAVAAGVYSSPLAVAARTAQFAYQAGQLAWTGQTSFLLGSVQVSQPYALKDLRNPHSRPDRHASHPAPLEFHLRAPILPHLQLHLRHPR